MSLFQLITLHERHERAQEREGRKREVERRWVVSGRKKHLQNVIKLIQVSALWLLDASLATISCNQLIAHLSAVYILVNCLSYEASGCAIAPVRCVCAFISRICFILFFLLSFICYLLFTLSDLVCIAVVVRWWIEEHYIFDLREHFRNILRSTTSYAVLVRTLPAAKLKLKKGRTVLIASIYSDKKVHNPSTEHVSYIAATNSYFFWCVHDDDKLGNKNSPKEIGDSWLDGSRRNFSVTK